MTRSGVFTCLIFVFQIFITLLLVVVFHVQLQFIIPASKPDGTAPSVQLNVSLGNFCACALVHEFVGVFIELFSFFCVSSSSSFLLSYSPHCSIKICPFR